MFANMLSSLILTKCNIRPSNGVLVQWLNVTVRLCSSSSSSDSSDSDSDSEKTIPKKTHVESSQNASAQTKHGKSTKTEKVQEQKPTIEATKKPAADLNEYLNSMMKARKLEKTIDVAVKPKQKKIILNKFKPIPYEKQLKKAAEDVADTLGGDKTKTTSDLLEKVLASRLEKMKVEQLEKISNLQKHKKRQKDLEYTKEDSQNERKKSVIYNLLEEYNKVRESSASKKISEKSEEFSSRLLKQDINIWNGKPSREFENMGPTSSNIPEMKTWKELEQRELKALTTYPPANIFQEMILWTEQGKLWKFPIDNEQGMEEEQNVHFSEHVFMERHLKDWCPKSGPVRHFMELVCNGLSKNPYMTVQEKVNHIMWYKEYFESKRDLLQEIGVIGESVSKKTPEIQES